jgi:hypothetical protein
VHILFGLISRERLLETDSCLLVLDADKAIYRVSNQDAAAGTGAQHCRVSVEFNPGYASQLYGEGSDEQLLERIVLELVMLGVISDISDFQLLRSIQARAALPFANNQLVASTGELAELASQWPGLELTAGLLNVGVSSFNDQVIQGLKLADGWSK